MRVTATSYSARSFAAVSPVRLTAHASRGPVVDSSALLDAPASRVPLIGRADPVDVAPLLRRSDAAATPGLTEPTPLFGDPRAEPVLFRARADAEPLFRERAEEPPLFRERAEEAKAPAPLPLGGGPTDRGGASELAGDRASERPPVRSLDGLSSEQRAVVTELIARDREVRSHEAAHQAAGADLAGAASFALQTGPDGRSYAVGGEVPISIRAGSSPEETARNARQARAAALAPANPSPQDFAVAAIATRIEQQALAAARERRAEEQAAMDTRKASRALAAYRATDEAAPASV